MALITGNSGTAKFMDANGSNFFTLAAHGTTTADVAYTWPAADGASGTVLTTDASGVMSWAAAGGSTIVSGEYTGDGATSLNITGLGMTPKWVKIFLQGLSNNENVQSWETTPEILNDITDGTAIRHNTSTYQTEINTIIGLSSGYFTVDDNSADEHPNVLGGKYNYIAIG